MTERTTPPPASLHVDVKGRAGDFAVDAAFTARAGVTVLFGKSGAGKSTLIDMIAGLRRPTGGRITLDGETLFDADAGIDVKPEARGVGYVFQNARLFPHMSVAGNLTYGMNRLPTARREATFRHVVELLGLDGLLARRPATLSGGERQRVAIGRALLAGPRVLLMDEPLSGLDAQRKSEVLPYIERLSREFALPVIYVSHAVEEVVRLADTLVLVDDGHIRAQGPLEDIMTRLDLGPLTGRYDAGAVLNATVAAHDDALHLTRLDVAGHPLFTPRVNVAVGETVRLRIRARDVALALTPPAETSILNQLPVTVAEQVAEPGAYAELSLAVTPAPGHGTPTPPRILARITRKSLVDLGLDVGAPAVTLIKAVAIDRHSLGGLGRGRVRTDHN